MDTIRVLLADKHDGVRSGLVSLLSKEGKGIEVVGEARDGREAIEMCRERSPDVLLLDLRLPDMAAPEVARQLQGGDSPVRVLAISAFFGLKEDQSITRLLESGVNGCITKDEALELLTQAIRSVARGERWLSPMVQDYLSGTSQSGAGPAI